MRQTFPDGIREIKLDEGLPGGKPALKAYRDSGGVPTIGWGHTKGVVMGMTCTVAQAERWLDQDLDEAERAVSRMVKVPLNDWQFATLVSFVFNVGIAGFLGSTLLRLLNAGNYDAVPEQLMRWVYDVDPKTGKKVRVPGLVNRRAKEVERWTRGNAVVRLVAEGTPLERPEPRPARPTPPPAPAKLLETSTGKAQATALVAGGTAAATELASKTFGDTLREMLGELSPLAWAMESVKYALVVGTLVLIGWTLWDRRRKLREGR